MLRHRRPALPGMLLALTLGLAGCSDLGTKVKLEARGEVSSVALDFGTLTLTEFATRAVTVRNTGNAPLAGDATTTCPEFQLTQGAGPFTLEPGGARDIVVRFQPAAVTGYACQLDLGPSLPAVALAGSGADQPSGAAWTVVPSSLDFGAVAVGQSAFRNFRITSTGTAPVTVNVVAGCSDYLPVTGGGPAVIAPGDFITVSVLFNPLAGGSYPCVIAVGPGIPGVSVTGFATTISFARDIQPIFDARCTGCHGGNGGMFLDAASSYGNLVNVTSFGYAPAKRVVPFDPTNSVLYRKLSGTGFGPRMPQGGPFLLPAQLDNVKNWILEGARNN